MTALQHHNALLGTGTLARLVANLHSDHSLIFADLDRQALLGRCDDVERRVQVAAAKHTRPFLPDTEDRTDLFAELDARSVLFAAEGKRLDDIRTKLAEQGALPQAEVLQALNDAWARFSETNQELARKTNPKYFTHAPASRDVRRSLARPFTTRHN